MRCRVKGEKAREGNTGYFAKGEDMPSWQGHILKNYLALRRLISRRGAKLDLTRNRANTEATGSTFKPLRPAEYAPVVANSVPAEWVIPDSVRGGRTVLYLHGGYFNAGSIASHRSLAANLAGAARAKVLTVGYRLAPEHPFPAGLDDALTIYRWLLDQGCPSRQMIVAGDSAGGALALALLVQLRDQGQSLPALAVLLSPVTDLAMTGESWVANANADYMIDAAWYRESANLYLQGADPRTPLASPLFAQLHGLPPLLIQVGSREMLLSDALLFAQKARDAGVDVALEVWPEMQHEWQFLAGFLPEGRQALWRIGEYIDARMMDAEE